MAYRDEIKKYKILSQQEETDKFNEYIKTGDVKVKNYLIEHNLQNTRNLANTFHKKNNMVDQDELYCIANEVLINCVANFNPDFGNRFFAYLQTSVIYRFMKYIAADASVRVPSNKTWLFYKIKHSTNRDEFTDKDLKDYRLYSKFNFVRFKKSVYDNDEYELEIEDDHYYNNLENKELSEHLKEYLTFLNDKEQFIINSFYGINGHDRLKLYEIGNLYGDTRTGIGGIKQKALKKLHKMMRRYEL